MKTFWAQYGVQSVLPLPYELGEQGKFTPIHFLIITILRLPLEYSLEMLYRKRN
jgi:hypothetical protein